MMLTKTQIEIMKVFTSKIDEKFSINKIATQLDKFYPLVHRSIKPLIGKGLLVKDKNDLISLNYKADYSEFAHIEEVKKEEFLKENDSLRMFSRDVLDRIKLDFFILLVFGSSVESKNPRDIDILFIIGDKDDINETEEFLNNIAFAFSNKFDINVISVKSAYEMLSKRDKLNVMNETLNKHILLFGAENYYRILKNAR